MPSQREKFKFSTQHAEFHYIIIVKKEKLLLSWYCICCQYISDVMNDAKQDEHFWIFETPTQEWLV